MDEMTKPERTARMLMGFSIEAMTGFEDLVKRGETKEALPILFALRMLVDMTNPSQSFGNFCSRILLECKDPAIAGGLFALVALHAPQNLTGLRKPLIATGLFDAAALEAIIHLRNQLLIKSGAK